MPPYPPETRPYRVVLYVVFFGFTLLWIGLVARSIAVDLYGSAPVSSLTAPRPGVADCVSELEALYRRMSARSALSLELTPQAERAWDSFAREFEDRLEQLQSRCTNAGGPADEPVRQAIAQASGKLQTLRLHLSRCGEEGEAERRGVADALAELRRVVGLSR